MTTITTTITMIRIRTTTTIGTTIAATLIDELGNSIIIKIGKNESTVCVHVVTTLNCT